jgi:hypothetical protein
MRHCPQHVQMPVRVDDRDYRQLTAARRFNDARRMCRMAPAIDRDPSVGTAQQHRVAIGLRTRDEYAADEHHSIRDGFARQGGRRGCRRRAASEQGEQQSVQKAHVVSLIDAASTTP